MSVSDEDLARRAALRGTGEVLAVSKGRMIESHDAVSSGRPDPLGSSLARATFEASPSGLLLLSPDGVVLAMNAAFGRIYGITPAESVGRDYLAFAEGLEVSRLDGEEGEVLVAPRALRGERVAPILQLVRNSRTGREFVSRCGAEPVVEGGRFVATVITAEDATRGETAEASLRQSEQRFRAAVGAVGTLWTNNAEGRMEGEQAGWAALTGQTRAEYEGYGWADAVHPEDAQPTVNAWNEAVRERRTFGFEHRVRTAKGEWGRFAIRAVPVLDEDGQVREWVGVHLDVTDLHEALQALRRSEADLERRVEERTEALTRANRDLDQFAYSVAHDLRAPLRAIVSTSRILLEDMEDRIREEEADLLRRQAASGVRLAQIVDDLLGFARLAQAQPRKAEFDMTALVHTVAEPVWAMHGSACEIRVQEGLRAMGDPSLVGYVLTNLLDNACKFSPEGGRVTVGEKDGAFFVRDQGVGFDMAHAGKLFEAFERLVGQHQFEGTGVGLANVRRIVEKHGGHVWAESEPGKGATFWFTLGA